MSTQEVVVTDSDGVARFRLLLPCSQSSSAAQSERPQKVCSGQGGSCTKIAGADGFCFVHHMINRQIQAINANLENPRTAIAEPPHLLLGASSGQKFLLKQKTADGKMVSFLASVIPDSASSAGNPDTSSATSTNFAAAPPAASSELKKEKEKCKTDGCNNYARRRSLCLRHWVRRTCQVDHRQNSARKDRLCQAHDPLRPEQRNFCSMENCKKQARESGFWCFDHGPRSRKKGPRSRKNHGPTMENSNADLEKRKERCKTAGCKNYVRRRGLCSRHGGQRKGCSMDKCKKRVRIGELCQDPGSERISSADVCTALARNRDLCTRHASTVNGMRNGRKICLNDGCVNFAKKKSDRCGPCNSSLSAIRSDATDSGGGGELEHFRPLDSPIFTCDDPELLQTIIDCSMPATDGEESDSGDLFTCEETGEDVGNVWEETGSSSSCSTGTEPAACSMENKAPVTSPHQVGDKEMTDSFAHLGHVKSGKDPGQNGLPAFGCESTCAHRDNVMETMGAESAGGIICGLPSSDPASVGDPVSGNEIMQISSGDELVSLDHAHMVAPESVDRIVDEIMSVIFLDCATPDSVLAEEDSIVLKSDHVDNLDCMSGQPVTLAEEVSTAVFQTDIEMDATETDLFNPLPGSPFPAIQSDSDTELRNGDFASMEGDQLKDTVTLHSVHPRNTAVHVPVEVDFEAAGIQYMRSTGSWCYRCAVCRKHFSTKPLLDLHVLQHNTECEQLSERVCPECGYVAMKFGALMEHVSQHALRREDKVPCIFNESSKVKRHMNKAHAEVMQSLQLITDVAKEFNGYMCVICGFTTFKSEEFGAHTVQHKENDIFPCGKCPRSYPSYAKLRFHYHQSHTGEYGCERCSKICHTRQRLAAHVRSCSAGRAHCLSTPENFAACPYRCDECQRGFVVRKSFMKHMSDKHPGRTDHRMKPGGARKKAERVNVDSTPEESDENVAVTPEPRRSQRLCVRKPTAKKAQNDAPSGAKTDRKVQKVHQRLDTECPKGLSVCTVPSNETGNAVGSVREPSPEIFVKVTSIRPVVPKIEITKEATKKDLPCSPFSSLHGTESTNSSTGYDPVSGSTDASNQVDQTVEGGLFVTELENEDSPRPSKRKCPVDRTEQRDVMDHLRVEHPKCTGDPVQCDPCGQIYTDGPCLERYKLQAHQQGPATDRAAVIEYIRTTKCYQYTCRKCHKIFRKKTLLDLHILGHSDQQQTEESAPVTKCPDCEFVGTNFCDLIQHVSLHAVGPTEKRECMLCGRPLSATSSDNHRIKRHMLRAHPNEMKAITERHKSQPCRCCKVVFTRKSDLDQHVMEHKVNNVFPCNFCSESFDMYESLDAHFIACHRGVFSRTCLICKRVCKNAWKLQRHMKRCLEGKPPVQPKGKVRQPPPKFTTMDQRLPCNLCDSILASSDSMRYHMKWKHGGEKEKVMRERQEKRLNGTLKKVVPLRLIKAFEEFPFGCVECQMGYQFKVGLLKHNAAKHPEKDMEIE